MRKIARIIGLLVILGLIWYLFIKKYDYQVSFVEKTAPGVIFQGVEDWVDGQVEKGDIEILELQKSTFTSLRQKLKMGDSTLVFDWHIESLTDSTTKTTVLIKDVDHSMATRIKNLYTNPPLKQVLISRVSHFKKSIETHLKGHRVNINGLEDIPTKFYAYISIKSPLQEKAKNMIASNGGILGWLRENGFKVLGKPTLEVTSWDFENEIIEFNYMFPVNEKDSIPEHPKFKFKKNKERKAIKATFHGNYRVSDRAWFALLEYAKRNHLEIEARPIEFFYNNPMLGGDELNWKAEIFMPLKEIRDD